MIMVIIVMTMVVVVVISADVNYADDDNDDNDDIDDNDDNDYQEQGNTSASLPAAPHSAQGGSSTTGQYCKYFFPA